MFKFTGNNNNPMKTGGIELQPKKISESVKKPSGGSASVLENSKNKTTTLTKAILLISVSRTLKIPLCVLWHGKLANENQPGFYAVMIVTRICQWCCETLLATKKYWQTN